MASISIETRTIQVFLAEAGDASQGIGSTVFGRNAVKQGMAKPALVPAASPDVANGFARKELIVGLEMGGSVVADINHQPYNDEPPQV